MRFWSISRTSMKSGWKRSAAGMTTSSIAARMAASPESPAQRAGTAGDTCCLISCAYSSSGAVHVTKEDTQGNGKVPGMGRLMEVPSPSSVPTSCSAPVCGKDPAWKGTPSLHACCAHILVSMACAHITWAHLVCADEQDVWVVIEHIVCAVAVVHLHAGELWHLQQGCSWSSAERRLNARTMCPLARLGQALQPAAHIEIEDHDAAAAPTLHVPSSDGDCAEEAEAHRPLCLQRSCIAAGDECLVPRLHASALGIAHSITASAARQTVSAGHSACKHAGLFGTPKQAWHAPLHGVQGAGKCQSRMCCRCLAALRLTHQ